MSHPFIECCLYTKEGGYVETVKVPPFRMLPDVLIWGTRVFRFSDGSDLGALPIKIDKTNAPVYLEAFAWAVIDLEPPFRIPENAT